MRFLFRDKDLLLPRDDVQAEGSRGELRDGRPGTGTKDLPTLRDRELATFLWQLHQTQDQGASSYHHPPLDHEHHHPPPGHEHDTKGWHGVGVQGPERGQLLERSGGPRQNHVQQALPLACGSLQPNPYRSDYEGNIP